MISSTTSSLSTTSSNEDPGLPGRVDKEALSLDALLEPNDLDDGHPSRMTSASTLRLMLMVPSGGMRAGSPFFFGGVSSVADTLSVGRGEVERPSIERLGGHVQQCHRETEFPFCWDLKMDVCAFAMHTTDHCCGR